MLLDMFSDAVPFMPGIKLARELSGEPLLNDMSLDCELLCPLLFPFLMSLDK